MALSYDLELSSSIKPAQALELLIAQLQGLSWSEDRTFALGPTTTIDACDALPVTKEIIEEAFHFTPSLSVSFRFASNTDFDDFKHNMLQGTLRLLGHAQDAVLLFNGEIIVLQWLGGRLVFNSDYSIWDEEWLKSRLPTPLERRPLPSPLL